MCVCVSMCYTGGKTVVLYFLTEISSAIFFVSGFLLFIPGGMLFGHLFIYLLNIKILTMENVTQ